MSVSIRPFDPHHASEPDWQALYALEVARDHEYFPEDPPMDPGVHRKMRLTEQPAMRERFWLAFDPAGTPAGFAWLELEDLPENAHLGFSTLYIAPAFRRQGLGSRLLGCEAAVMHAEGRRTLLSYVKVLDPQAPDWPGLAFNRHFGGGTGMAMTSRQLDLARIDRSLLESWRRRAAPLYKGGPEGSPAEFELVSLGLPYPEHELERISRMLETMNEAPRGNLDMADIVHTPDFLRQIDAYHRQRGVDRWNFSARHVPSGEFAGFTEIILRPDKPTVAQQAGTSVRGDFRGRGLGRWLKAEMALRLLNERPQVRYIRTTNADMNAPMLKINDEMGFTIHHEHILVQAPVEELVRHVPSDDDKN